MRHLHSGPHHNHHNHHRGGRGRRRESGRLHVALFYVSLVLALFGLGNLNIFLPLVSGSRFVARGVQVCWIFLGDDFLVTPLYLAVTCLLVLPVVCLARLWKHFTSVHRKMSRIQRIAWFDIGYNICVSPRSFLGDDFVEMFVFSACGSSGYVFTRLLRSSWNTPFST